jgi:hypothetical protein
MRALCKLAFYLNVQLFSKIEHCLITVSVSALAGVAVIAMNIVSINKIKGIIEPFINSRGKLLFS